MKLSYAIMWWGCGVLAACSSAPIQSSSKHIQQSSDTAQQVTGVIPQTSKNAIVLPPPISLRKS